MAAELGLARPGARPGGSTGIDFRRIALSNSAYAGRELRDLRMEERFDAVVSRVRRGDVDIIATPDLILCAGDRLRVTAPQDRLAGTKDLGDSESALPRVTSTRSGWVWGWRWACCWPS